MTERGRVLFHSVGEIGTTMSGPGIRAFELAQALAGRFDVTLAAPNESDAAPAGVAVVRAPADPAALLALLSQFDAVVAQKLPVPVMRSLARSPVRVVHDLYVPALTEGLAMLDAERQHPADARFHQQAMLAQRLALLTGDAFVCASDRQRDFWLGMLGALGRLDPAVYAADPTLRDLVEVVPFGVPAEPPAPGPPLLKGVVPGIGRDDRVLLWGGGVWNWFDPLTVIRAVDEVARRRDDVKLLFLGLRHPQVPAMAMAARALELARERGLLGRVVFANEDWVSYGERARFLLEADVGVSAHFDTVETRYAFRTRLLDYLWAGLPTITTAGDVLGDLVAEKGLGRTPPAGDDAAWVAAIEELLEPAALEVARANVEAAREAFAWPRVAEPLARLLEAPRDAPPERRRLRELQLRAEEILLRLRTSYEVRGPVGFLGSRGEEAVEAGRRAVGRGLRRRPPQVD